jgi:hypothetical protein
LASNRAAVGTGYGSGLAVDLDDQPLETGLTCYVRPEVCGIRSTRVCSQDAACTRAHQRALQPQRRPALAEFLDEMTGDMVRAVAGAAVVWRHLDLENQLSLVTEPDGLVPHHLRMTQTLSMQVEAPGETLDDESAALALVRLRVPPTAPLTLQQLSAQGGVTRTGGSVPRSSRGFVAGAPAAYLLGSWLTRRRFRAGRGSAW